MLAPFLGAFALALADRWPSEVDVAVEETRWGVELGIVFCPLVGRRAIVVIVPVSWEQIGLGEPEYLAWEAADDAIGGLKELLQTA